MNELWKIVVCREESWKTQGVGIAFIFIYLFIKPQGKVNPNKPLANFNEFK